MRYFLILVLLVMTSCGTIREQRTFSIGGSHSSLRTGDRESVSSGQIALTQSLSSSFELGASVGGVGWDFGSGSIGSDLFCNYILDFDGAELYAGPNVGWVWFDDNSVSYGAQVGLRIWFDSAFLFVQPTWTRYEIFDTWVDDMRIVVGAGTRF